VFDELSAVLLWLLRRGVVTGVIRTRGENTCTADHDGGEHPIHILLHNCKINKLMLVKYSFLNLSAKVTIIL
jgi:hypothetical protein